MGTVRIGGDPEGYMDPPTITKSDKPGGASIIAQVLDMIGIGKQVAKEPDAAPAAAPETTQAVQPAPSQLPVLNEASSAFVPMEPLGSDWGKRYLESLKPIKTIDPNSAL